MSKKTGQKSTTSGDKAGAKKKPASQGDDSKSLYKKMPDEYKAVQKVKKAIEIRGRPIALMFDTETKTGSVTIEDIDGKGHTARIPKALMFDTIVHFMGQRGTGFETKYKEAEKGEQKKMLERLLTYTPRSPILFRLGEDNEGLYVFGVMSDKWRQVAAEDYYDITKGILKKLNLKAVFDLKESDGIHGGIITVEPKDDGGVIQPKAVFNFGKWDGYHRVRGQAGGKVIVCSNLLTIDVRGAMGHLEIGAFAALSERHVGEDVKFETLVEKVAEAIGAYGSIVNAAKKVTIPDDKLEMILQYYSDKNIISARTLKKLQTALKSKDIQQVKGTMYGLSMALSFVGTHDNEIKDGVKKSLQNLAGEILVVSQDQKGYWKLISSHHEKRKEKTKDEKPAKVEEKKPEKEEAPKVEAEIPKKKRAVKKGCASIA